jgi:hypothetical protein
MSHVIKNLVNKQNSVIELNGKIETSETYHEINAENGRITINIDLLGNEDNYYLALLTGQKIKVRLPFTEETEMLLYSFISKSDDNEVAKVKIILIKDEKETDNFKDYK